MKKKENFTSVFYSLQFSLLLFLLFQNQVFIFSSLDCAKSTFSICGKCLFGIQFFLKPLKDSTISKIKEENRELVGKIVSQSVLQKENSALADQFTTTSIRSQILLPAKIIGAPSFIPAVSNPQSLIIDRGTKII